MTTRIRSAALAVSLALAVGIHSEAWAAQAPQTFSTWTAIPLQNGPNEIDIDGDGRVDLVFVASRDNANAHGYDLVTFYRRGNGDDPKWQLVPFDGMNGRSDEDAFRTHQGADCQLRGIAVVRKPAPNEPITVVVGERDFGQSYADTASVKFVVYKIAHNDDGSPGAPPVYFQPDRTINARSKYCDVNEAFASELGIRIKN
jgi:hypothetical protein